MIQPDFAVRRQAGDEASVTYNRPLKTPYMNPQILRILDANANRAREALRVIEDYARFVLNDDQISGTLKQLRHDFAAAIAGFSADAILHRNTPGDVGVSTKTATELKREDIAHVVTAAGKRLGEALRTIEEYAKTFDVPTAATIESLRYRFYDIEQKISRMLLPAACGLAHLRLYVLITESCCKRPWLESAEHAILGGADALQLREKDLPSGEFLTRARHLVNLCRQHNVICIINDRPDIAILSNADGVHVGQDDLPAIEVRKLIGRDKIVGVSTHNLDQAQQAVRDGADYIGVGPIFRSSTKPRDFLPGLPFAREIAQANLPIPAVAIAGITLDNVDEVITSGIRAVALTAAVLSAKDVRAAAAKFKEKLNREGAKDAKKNAKD
jgi:thiamine-phosphate pyrophosphorylase